MPSVVIDRLAARRRIAMMPARDCAFAQTIVLFEQIQMRRMSPVRLLATILPTLAIACAIASNAALALDTYYLVDIKAKNPRFIAKWQSTVPGPFSTNDWIRSLDGMYPPVDGLVISYKKFYLGWVCWPHDCVGNRAVFLIAQDGSEGYGMLRSKALNADDVFFGAPSVEIRQRLKDHLDK